MPAYTYLNEHDKNQPIQDKTLQEALDECRKMTNQDWHVIERTRTTKRWFRKPETCYFYSLLVGEYGGYEYQEINFHRDGTDWTLNFFVPAELAIAYLYGTIGGTYTAKREARAS